eukprot:gene39613-48226_t
MSRLMNSDSLKSLLATGHAKMKRSNVLLAQELVHTILMEETGTVVRRIKRNDVKKRKKKKVEKRSAFDATVSASAMERSLAFMLARHNIHEYADMWELPREDIGILEKEFKECARQVSIVENKLRLVCEELGDGDKVLDEEGVQIALEYTGLLETEVANEIIEKLGQPVTVTQPDPLPTSTEEGKQPSDVIEERQLYQIEKVPHFTRCKLLLNNLVRILTSRIGMFQNPSFPAPSLGTLNYSQSAHFDAGDSRIEANRPVSHPELSIATDMTSMLQSQSARMLPPIKLNPTQSTVNKQQSRPRKRLLDAAGFDEAYTRETPRMLHYDNTEQHDPVKQVEALRRELQIAKAGVSHLNKLVDKNI